jgi:hypothetical protein
VCAESVKSAILLVVGKDTLAFSIFHNQIKSKVLDEVVCVVSQRLTVERVEEGMSSSIGSSAAPVCLPALSVLL